MSFSQENLSYQKVNSETYSAFMNEDWNEVIKIGNKAFNQGHNFYYLNLRVGIAHFKKQEYSFAKPFLLSAAKQNDQDTLVNLFNYWNSINLGDVELANYFRLQIPKETRSRHNISTHSINSISAIIGIKRPGTNNFGKTLLSGNANINFNWSKKGSSNIYFGDAKQELYWGEFEQKHIGAQTNLLLSSSILLQSNLNYYSIQSNIDFTNPANELRSLGTNKGQLYTFNISATKSIKNFKIGIGYTSSIQTFSIKGNNTLTQNYLSTDYIDYINQLELRINQTIHLNNKDIWLYGNLFTPIQESTTSWSSEVGFKFKPHQKNWFGIQYLYNSQLNAIEDLGSTIQNGDYLSHRISLSWDYYRNKNWSFNTSLSKEYRNETFSSYEYTNSSIFTTLTYKF